MRVGTREEGERRGQGAPGLGSGTGEPNAASCSGCSLVMPPPAGATSPPPPLSTEVFTGSPSHRAKWVWLSNVFFKNPLHIKTGIADFYREDLGSLGPLSAEQPEAKPIAAFRREGTELPLRLHLHSHPWAPGAGLCYKPL